MEVMGVMVVTDPKDGDSKVDVKGISNGPTPQQGQPGRSPESSAVITPGPLFDDQQLRRFQELYAQAPWLYTLEDRFPCLHLHFSIP